MHSWRQWICVVATAGACRAGDPAASCGSLRLAIADLAASFPGRYTNAPGYLARLDAITADLTNATPAPAADAAARLESLRREALLANPLLDIDRLLVVRRSTRQMGLPANWQGNSSLPRTGYSNEIAVLSNLRGGGDLATLYRPPGGEFVGDVDLAFDASRLLFSMPAGGRTWRVFELSLAGGAGPAVLPMIPDGDVDNYDPCLLPDGDVIFASSAPFAGVPCVTGRDHVANLYRWHRADGSIRRLTFDQDHDWCPTVLSDGRVLYLRWEYSDLPHFVSRILFTMNPDGTAQRAFYGSNSYWPNAMFFARPVPGDPARFFAVVGGHHDHPRMGELVLFDTRRGRFEAEGAVQRIPGRGRAVEPVLLDGLTKDSWPKFLHPWPLSDRHVLVAARPAPKSEWGLYLADTFDNLVLIKELPGEALLEPIPLVAQARPPVPPSRVDPEAKDAVVQLADVHAGPGLRGVPRGTVKRLRLFTYQFAYHGMGGQVNRVGLDGPWDIKRVLGTVPVEPDGSAHFRVPANTPIAVQPLDADGAALQLMRSWFVGMPGEVVGCVGCHERDGTAPPYASASAFLRAPSDVTPWHGPVRGFSFEREVQPVLDRHCVGCHDGRAPGRPDFSRRPGANPPGAANSYQKDSWFPPSYVSLFPYVRGHTIESDMHLLEPAEYHASTTHLVQMLRAGHHGVAMGVEDWDRLFTWIDLNKPAHGTWTENVGADKVAHQRDRRRDLMRRYAGIDEDPEAILPDTGAGRDGGAAVRGLDHGPTAVSAAARTEPGPPGNPTTLPCEGWPFDVSEAGRRQTVDGSPERTLDLGGGVALCLRRIPAGRFVSGGEAPRVVEMPRPFWMAVCEIDNAQFARFDPSHDSRLETGDFLQFSVAERGWPLDGPRQPAVRVSWHRATEFCRWLSTVTGEPFSLPDEMEWEYACRAGAATELWFGAPEDDFTAFANLADATFRGVETLPPWRLPSGAIPSYRPAVAGANDGHRVSAPTGSFRPNAWGLHDMHGNVAEWTSSPFAPGAGAEAPRVVRGGSWSERPRLAGASRRIAYPPWQAVHNVGFRIISPAR